MTKSEFTEQLADWLYWYDTAFKGSNKNAAALLVQKLPELDVLLPLFKPEEDENDAT